MATTTADSNSDRELSLPERQLIEQARTSRDRSYAPYSDFRMGAAVRCSDGTVMLGALVENVSLGLAMCAERVALFNAVVGGSPPVALALVSDRTAGALTFPCGACLQVALELGGSELMVIVSDLDGSTGSAKLGDLLTNAPHARSFNSR